MAEVNGTAGDELLNGRRGADVVKAETGADTVAARGGADTVTAGGGQDVVRGGGGDDVLYGYGRVDRHGDSGVITVTQIGSGFERSLFAAPAPGDPRLYVVEQHAGAIRILDPDTGETLDTAFLDLPDAELAGGNEQGLLGLAFHPDYASNGRFYVHLTNAAGDVEIREYLRSGTDPAQADPDSGRVLLTVPHQGAINHNGGWIGFGPDGNLHIAVGDGGAGQSGNAQDLSVLLGKILRIDVNGDDFPGDDGRNYAIPADNPFVGQPGADEIWAYGLRNPFRAGFDSATGDFYIGDVGQSQWEEIDVIGAGSPGGLNFGWNIYEGLHPPPQPGFTAPITEYAHQEGPLGGQAVTGGYVYRGAGNDDGLYFFADFVSDNLWTLKPTEDGSVDFINRNDQLRGELGGFTNIASFAEGADGSLYAVSLSGAVFRLDPSAAAGDGGDRLSGGRGDDKAYGGAGDDQLLGVEGADRLFGGIGDDELRGGAGSDRLSGGDGSDVFVFRALSDSAVESADRIGDLAATDLIRLSGVDADSTVSGDQDFVLVADFSGEAGELRLRYAAGRDRTFLEGDVDGDGRADLRIVLDGDQRGFDGLVL